MGLMKLVDGLNGAGVNKGNNNECRLHMGLRNLWTPSSFGASNHVLVAGRQNPR